MGSVRAARERMELDMGESRYSEEQTESSQPAWPLASNASNQYPQIHGTAPQRPPRPNYIPSGLSEHGIVDHAQLQSQQYSRGEIQQQTKYWEPNYGTPGSITPGTTSSRDSAGSSVGSIPDFPIPAVPVNASQSGPKRAQNVGPPPIQRRGPSYYYSQSSYVAPIPEENIDMPQHAGYPPRRIEVPSQAWQNSAQDFYIDRSPSLSTPGDHLVESAGLLGNASTGNQHKPSLTTARPAINTLLPQKGLVASKPIVIDHTHLAAEHTVFVESMDSDDEDTSLRGRDSMEGTTFLRETSADSDLHAGGFLGEKDMIVSLTASRDHSPRRQDPRVEHLMVGLEKGGAIPIGTAPPIVEVETRAKPAAFDFTSEASNRASLTSLTDLIKRATKVKTNLEKGRTASRLGLLDFFTPSKPDLLKVTKDDRPRESLTDMLEAFPPPAINNTSRDNPSDNQWPAPFANNAGNMHHRPNGPLKRQKSKSPEGRRCCGLPIWGFILLLLLLIILVAAAVLIPIFLIVLPNQQKANAACPNAFPCSNGGHSFTAPTGCRCICTSGFTGSQCARSPLVASDCTTANLQGLDQLTMGTKTLPLIVGASKYSIPLNSTILLSGFSFNKLSCGDENNLVTFLNTGSQQKRYLNPPAPTPVTALKTRADPPKIDAQSDSSLSSVVFDKSGTPTSSGAAPTATRPSTNQIGFAQTAVLYILQQNSLENANSMLNALDTAFHQGTWYGPIVVNSSIIVDLRLSKITMGGSSVGVGSK